MAETPEEIARRHARKNQGLKGGATANPNAIPGAGRGQKLQGRNANGGTQASDSVFSRPVGQRLAPTPGKNEAEKVANLNRSGAFGSGMQQTQAGRDRKATEIAGGTMQQAGSIGVNEPMPTAQAAAPAPAPTSGIGARDSRGMPLPMAQSTQDFGQADAMIAKAQNLTQGFARPTSQRALPGQPVQGEMVASANPDANQAMLEDNAPPPPVAATPPLPGQQSPDAPRERQPSLAAPQAPMNTVNPASQVIAQSQPQVPTFDVPRPWNEAAGMGVGDLGSAAGFRSPEQKLAAKASATFEPHALAKSAAAKKKHKAEAPEREAAKKRRKEESKKRRDETYNTVMGSKTPWLGANDSLLRRGVASTLSTLSR